MKFYAFFVIFAVSSVAWGDRPPPAFQTLSRSSVLVSVDGAELTKDDVLRQAKVFMSLNMNKYRRTRIGKNDQRIFRSLCRNAVDQFLDRSVAHRYAVENDVCVSTDLLNKVTRRIERQFGVRSKKLRRRHNLADLKYMLGRNAGILDEEIKAQAEYVAVTNHILFARPAVVSDEMVEKRLQSFRAFNERAMLTNVLVYARATNVWRRIVNKELTFEQAATNFSEDAYLDLGCEWGSFGRDQLADDPAVFSILPKLKVGDITAPLPSDYGLAILRLDEIEDDKTYTFSRVFFRLPVIYDEETPEQARDVLRDQEEKAVVDREFESIRKGLKIEYPNGTNLFDKTCAPLVITKEDLAD